MTGQSRGAHLFKTAFTKAWRLAGQPTLAVVPPVSEWTLPPGVSYDPRQDGFVDADGYATDTPDWSTQALMRLPYLPKRGRKRMSLEIMGVTISESTGATVRWSAEAEDALRRAWGVVIGSRLYRVRGLTLKPEGVSVPHEIDLELGEA